MDLAQRRKRHESRGSRGGDEESRAAIEPLSSHLIVVEAAFFHSSFTYHCNCFKEHTNTQDLTISICKHTHKHPFAR